MVGEQIFTLAAQGADWLVFTYAQQNTIGATLIAIGVFIVIKLVITDWWWL